MKASKKWIVGATSAALVASAIVPVASAASFSDIENNDHKDAILALADAGIISGYSDGTFKPNAIVTRSNVVKLLGKWLVSEGYEIPSDYNTVARFTDLSTDYSDQELVKYAALVKDAGVFKGSNDKLMHTNNMTREQMAVVLVRAIKTVYGIDLVADYQAANFESSITDLDKATADENREAITALEYAELTTVKTFNPKNSLTRGQFASFLNRSIEYAAKEEVKDVKVESVTAIGAKTIKVEFNTAVDATASDFKVTKDTLKTNIAEVVIADDKKSATIELTSKLTEGTYTVAVAQNDADALTGSVTVEDEKIGKIEILGDEAVLTDDSTLGDSTADKATVGVKISNQYGEDITKSRTDVTITVGGVGTTGSLSTKGTLTMNIVDTASIGDKVVVTIVDGSTATSATKTLTLSAKAAASEVTFGELYNKDGKTLTQDTKLSTNVFYLPITVKDQYGNEITDATKAQEGLLITNTNSTIATFGDIEEVTINDEDVLAMKVTAVNYAGTTNVIAVSKSTGKSAQATVTVESGVKLSSVTVSAPTELVTANKDIYFPLTVVDTEGNEVTTLAALNKISDKLTPSQGDIVEGNANGDSGLFVKVDADEVDITANKAVTVVVTSTSGKVSTQTVIPKAEAVATVITGIDSDVASALRANSDGITIDNTDLVVEDQYGQVITDSEVLKTLKFEVTSTDKTAITVTDEGDSESWTIKPVADTTKTSGKVTFKLLDEGEAVESSAYSKTYSIIKDSEFVSYEVAEVGTVYDEVAAQNTDNAAYDKKIKVYGVLANGSKVLLTHSDDYSVSSTNAVLNEDVAADGVIDVEKAYTTYGTNETEIVLPLTVTINATGEKLTQEVTISKVAPKAAKVQVIKNDTAAAVIAGTSKAVAVTKINFTATEAFTRAKLLEKVDVIVTDQYGVTVNIEDASGQFPDGTTLADVLTFTKVTGDDLAFTGNGTQAAAVTELNDGSEFNAVVTVGAVNSAAVKVTVDGDFSTITTTNTKDVETAKQALTDLEFDSTNNATSDSPVITKKADHSNGATYTFTVSDITGDGVKASVASNGNIAITRGTAEGSFTVTVTIKKGKVTDTKQFTVTVPTTGSAVTVAAK